MEIVGTKDEDKKVCWIQYCFDRTHGGTDI